MKTLPGPKHIYISTACQHEHEDPDLHKLCRQTCKWCKAPCSCPQHGENRLDITSVV